VPEPAPAPAPAATITVAAVIEELIEAAEAGRARDRYRPRALRELTSSLRDQVAPELGDMGIDEVRRGDVQELVDQLEADAVELPQIRAVAGALRALFAHAIEQGYVTRNPAERVLLPEDETDHRDSRDYQPLTLLPERILSLVLRIVVLLFVLFALVTIAGSA
jgi:site-specific recombinase XerD